MSNTELKKKEEKELKLKQFVQEADEISILEVSDTNAQKTNATSDKPKGTFKSEISMLEDSLDKNAESSKKEKSPKPPKSLKLNIDEDKSDE